MVGLIAEIEIEETYENPNNRVVESKKCKTKGPREITPYELQGYLKAMGDVGRCKYVLEEILEYKTEADKINVKAEESNINFVNVHSNIKETEDWIEEFIKIDSRSNNIDDFIKRIYKTERSVLPAFKNVFEDYLD